MREHWVAQHKSVSKWTLLGVILSAIYMSTLTYFRKGILHILMVLTRISSFEPVGLLDSQIASEMFDLKRCIWDQRSCDESFVRKVVNEEFDSVKRLRWRTRKRYDSYVDLVTIDQKQYIKKTHYSKMLLRRLFVAPSGVFEWNLGRLLKGQVNTMDVFLLIKEESPEYSKTVVYYPYQGLDVIHLAKLDRDVDWAPLEDLKKQISSARLFIKDMNFGNIIYLPDGSFMLIDLETGIIMPKWSFYRDIVEKKNQKRLDQYKIEFEKKRTFYRLATAFDLGEISTPPSP